MVTDHGDEQGGAGEHGEVPAGEVGGGGAGAPARGLGVPLPSRLYCYGHGHGHSSGHGHGHGHGFGRGGRVVRPGRHSLVERCRLLEPLQQLRSPGGLPASAA